MIYLILNGAINLTTYWRSLGSFSFGILDGSKSGGWYFCGRQNSYELPYSKPVVPKRFSLWPKRETGHLPGTQTNEKSISISMHCALIDQLLSLLLKPLFSNLCLRFVFDLFMNLQNVMFVINCHIKYLIYLFFLFSGNVYWKYFEIIKN